MKIRTVISKVDPDDPAPRAIARAAELIRGGGLVAFAAETVYGLGADATNPEAVAKIFEAKGRPSFNPLIVHASSVAMARECVADWPDLAERLAERFWPGPLTLVLPRSTIIPDVVTAGRETVGVRIPRTVVARRLIEAAGVPIAAPSANRSTGLSPTTAGHVKEDLRWKIDMILDSGQTEVGLESTVLDLTTRQPHILRPGPIGAAELDAVLDGIRVVEATHSEDREGEPHASPGRMEVHYSPRTPAIRVDDPTDLLRVEWPRRAGLIVLGGRDVPAFPLGEGPSTRYDLTDPVEAMHDLYLVLHECDALQLPLLVLVPPPDLPEWRAIRDRLARAARPWAAG